MQIMVNEKKKKILTIIDTFLTIVIVIILSLNIAIYLLNKVALNFIGGD